MFVLSKHAGCEHIFAGVFVASALKNKWFVYICVSVL